MLCAFGRGIDRFELRNICARRECACCSAMNDDAFHFGICLQLLHHTGDCCPHITRQSVAAFGLVQDQFANPITDLDADALGSHALILQISLVAQFLYASVGCSATPSWPSEQLWELTQRRVSL